MKKLYKLRLFRLMLEYAENSTYEVYRIGTIVATRKKDKCREFLYGVDIPIVDIDMEYNFDKEGVQLTDEDAKMGYVVLKSDFIDKNKLETEKDLIKFNYDAYADMTMKLIQSENKLDCEEKGVVYGKSIRRSKRKFLK